MNKEKKDRPSIEAPQAVKHPDKHPFGNTQSLSALPGMGNESLCPLLPLDRL